MSGVCIHIKKGGKEKINQGPKGVKKSLLAQSKDE